jgi:P27 family predicted phage terminase small subunit
MAAGQRPTPVEQRVLEGNPRKHAIPEPLLVSGRPTLADPMVQAPEDLPAAGKDAWNAIVPQLAEVGLLDRVDRLMLEAMCLQWARAKQAGRVINAQGHLVKGAVGLKEHPSLKTERDSMRLFAMFADQFALTPVARTRLGLAEFHRRTLQAEFEDSIGSADLQAIDIEPVSEG